MTLRVSLAAGLLFTAALWPGTAAAQCTGCTITNVGADVVLTFNADGTFTPPAGVTSVRYLVVAGGGGGGGTPGVFFSGSPGGGGGGAGGRLQGTGFVVVPLNVYNIVVGTGGTGGAGAARGTDGGNSSFSTLVATGGGGGGTDGTGAGLAGGSGGGGADSGAAGAGAGGQGSAGGAGGSTRGGGGGGAGGIGAAGGAGSGAGGAGGAAANNDITGSSVPYAAGGAGGAYGTGRSNGASASANTGGGGGGANGGAAIIAGAQSGGAGGSGVVIIRYTPLPTTYFSRQDGNWNDPNTWSSTACGGAAGTTIPHAAADVTICNNHTVTVNVAAQALSVTLATGNNNVNLTHSGANSLTVGAGGVTFNGGTGGAQTKAWNINAGAATVNGPVAMNGGSNNSRLTRINLTTGTLDINGNLTMTAANAVRAVIEATGAASIFVSGDFTFSNGTLTPGPSSTFTYDTAGGWSLAHSATIQYRNLVVNKPGGTATQNGGTFSVLGDLTVTAGTLNIGTASVDVGGATSVTGTLGFTSTTGTATFGGDVTVNGGGVWNNSANEGVTFNGSLTNNGTFTSGTATQTFAGTAGAVWAGSSGLVFSGAAVVNANRTNNTTTEVVGNLSGSATVTNGASQMLRLGAGNTPTGFIATAAGNTVEYNGTGGQNVRINDYHNLTVNKSAGTATTSGGAVSIAGTLDVAQGTLSLNTADITANGPTLVSGTLLMASSTGTKTFNGDVTVNPGGTWNHTANAGIGMNGNLTNNGTFNASAFTNSTYTFGGSAAQTITGTASGTTVIPRLTLDNADGLSLTGNHDVEVSTLLTLTDGRITTNANVLHVSYATGNGDITGASATNFVVGNLRKSFGTGSGVVRNFEVGTVSGGVRYAPVNMTVGSISTAGTVTATTQASEHPDIGTSDLDPSASVNRYWTLTNGGLVFTDYDAVFNFVAADVDGGADTNAFEIQRWNGAAWNDIAVGARTATSTQGTGITTFGDFAIAEEAPPVLGSIVVTMTGDTDDIVAGSVFLTGTANGAPEDENTSFSNSGVGSFSTSVTTSAGSWLVDVAGSGNAGVTFTENATGMNIRWDEDGNSSTGIGGTRPAADGNAMSYTLSGSNRHAHAVASFAAAPSYSIAFVSAESAEAGDATTSTDSLSWMHTLPVDPVGKLVVGIAVEDPSCSGNQIVDTVMVDSVPMQFITGVQTTAGGYCARAELWYLDYGALDPPALPAAVGYWRFQEAAWDGDVDEVLDQSGNGLHGQVFNDADTDDADPAIPTVDGMGTCRYGEFDGTDQFVRVSYDAQLSLDDELTAMAWVNIDALPGGGVLKTILSRDFNYEFHVDDAGEIYWWWHNDANTAQSFTTTGANITPGQWHHVAVVYADTDQRIYVDGVLRGSASFTGGLRSDDTAPLEFGADQGAANRYWDGFLDEIRIYDSAFSQAQVSQAMNETYPCTDLVCFVDSFSQADGPLSSDWTTSSLDEMAFLPQIVSNRLRLTPATNNIGTRASLNRLFPGFGNRIEVEFDLYAYGRTGTYGADGITVVLSDATVVPAPGGYGGSLGYAPNTAADPDQPGFAGGWLGVALDEYGNFSSESEGRSGGVMVGACSYPGFPPDAPCRYDAVSVRGSGSAYAGYEWHTASATLSPGIDEAAATPTPGPGHRYRIIIDHSDSLQSWVSVERDTGSGFSYVVAPYDAKLETGQAEVPDNWLLSFTAGTGGMNNIHEIAFLSVCSTQEQIPIQTHHYSITHSGNGVTCLADDVTITAHASDHTPVDPGPVTITLDTTTGKGDWTVVTNGSGVLDNGTPGDGVATYTFPGNGETSVTIAFNYTDIDLPGDTESFHFTVTDGIATHQPFDDAENLEMTFARTGFQFGTVPGFTPIPAQIGGKPSNLLPGGQALGIRSIRSDDDDPSVCVPHFANQDLDIELGAECTNPAACAGAQITVNGDSIATSNDNAGDGAAGYTTVTLEFDAQGVAPLLLNYPDVGQTQLHARYEIPLEDDSPSTDFMLGSSNLFVWTPFTFEVTVTGNPAATGAGGGVLTHAGGDFDVDVRAVLWNAALDNNNDGIADGHDDTNPANNVSLTGFPGAPNFGNEGAQVALTRELVAPNPGGTPGSLAGDTLLTSFTGGAGSGTLTFSEVGIIELTAAIAGGSYLGETVSAPGASGHVGRFRAHHFDVTTTPTCGAFSYSGQPYTVAITARGQANNPLGNYDGGLGFAKATTLSNAGDTANFTNNVVAALDFTSGTATINDIYYTFPDAETLPTTLQMRGVDTDTASSAGYTEGTIQIRSGRMRLSNANGSELLALPVPFAIETYRDLGGGINGWDIESGDTCTTVAAPDVVDDNYQGALGSVTIGSVPQGSGSGNLLLDAPDVTGTVDLTIDLDVLGSPWLKFDWSGGGPENPVGRAAFGIYDGDPQRIYLREIY